MPTRISETLYRITNGWAALIALVVFVLFTALVLPGQAQQAGQAEEGAADAGSPGSGRPRRGVNRG